ncbi:histone demethylase SWIRM1 [Schizosaccharomyces cryophilus OY26]|uniref:Histone demethylase SWIRM1 n=1 Tax=Schizosaccharomyces cryophilus (strain OY26 / ATCC MYA-4695 / CBS 11777 / NBRC 106824 / NRRL Y48691) TaxID=653667 RepID=S9X6N4_SCHCR|nr:histone demethylase SWIRM1 [Schizosaccharomyces cryophilus OY26]EPY49431.1 histone demethylase SWIRM1 [Schizosaccharomyces cryophilus OY26]
MMELSPKDDISEVLNNGASQSTDPSLWAIFGQHSMEDSSERRNVGAEVDNGIFDLSQLNEHQLTSSMPNAMGLSGQNGLIAKSFDGDDNPGKDDASLLSQHMLSTEMEHKIMEAKGRQAVGGNRKGKRVSTTANSLERNGTQYVSNEAPIAVKSSIPALPRTTYERLCYESAIASGLSPDSLSSDEVGLLSEILDNPSWLSLYLKIRNGICYLWHRNPTLFVSFNEALGIVREKMAFPLASLAFEFLTRSGYINYGSLNISLSLQPGENLPQKTVAIVGAGMAGISCARQLANLFAQYEQDFINRGEKSPQLILYEASSRLGGHVFSHGVPIYDSLSEEEQTGRQSDALQTCVVNLSSDFLYGCPFLENDPLHIIVSQQLSLDEVIRQTQNVALYDSGDGRIDQRHIDRVLMLFRSLLDYFFSMKNDQLLNIVFSPKQKFILTLQNLDWRLVTDEFPLSNYDSLKDFLEDSFKNLNQLLHFSIAETRVFEWCVEYLKQMSCVPLELIKASSKCFINFPFGEAVPSYAIKNGMSTLIEALATTPSPLPVLFDHTVQSVNLEGQKAHLSFTNDTNITVDKVVMCLPINKYRESNVSFGPPISEQKLDALNKCYLLNRKKVIFLFKSQFWELHKSVFGSLTSSKKNYIYNDCSDIYGFPSLSVYVDIPAHQRVVDRDIVHNILLELSNIFKIENLQPLRTVITNWENNAYSNHYSYAISPDSSLEDYSVLRESMDDTIYFASEALSKEYSGTLRGAFQSGLLAAKDVLSSLIGDVAVPNTLIVEEKLEGSESNRKRSAGQVYGNGRKGNDDNKALNYYHDYLRLRKQRLEREEQECELLIAELLGARPVAPTRPSANPYLIYQKTQWHVCRALADQEKQRSTGDPEARATKNEIRAKLGKTWRALDDLGKQPWVDEVSARRANYSSRLEEYQRQINAYNVRAAQIRDEHRRKCESQPLPEEEARLKILSQEEDERAQKRRLLENTTLNDSDEEYREDMDYEEQIDDNFSDTFT